MSHANEIYDRRLSDAVVPAEAATALFGEAPVVFLSLGVPSDPPRPRLRLTSPPG